MLQVTARLRTPQKHARSADTPPAGMHCLLDLRCPLLQPTAPCSSLSSFNVSKLKMQFPSHPDHIHVLPNYMRLSHWQTQDVSIKAEKSIREHCSRIFARFVNLSPISVGRDKRSNPSMEPLEWCSIVIIGWETSCPTKWKFTLKKDSILYPSLRT